MCTKVPLRKISVYLQTAKKDPLAQKKGTYFNKRRLLKTLGVLAAGALLFVLYMVFSVWVVGMDLPKTAVLRRQNADWQSRLEQMGARLDRDEEVMSLLEVRDDRIYRSVYGMDEIPSAVRYAGIGGNDRHPQLEALDRGHVLRRDEVDELRRLV